MNIRAGETWWLWLPTARRCWALGYWPEAGMPVMEGKCALFQAFAGVDAFPLCVRSKDVDEIVHTVEMIAGSFGGINLEDIRGAPLL